MDLVPRARADALALEVSQRDLTIGGGLWQFAAAASQDSDSLLQRPGELILVKSFLVSGEIESLHGGPFLVMVGPDSMQDAYNRQRRYRRIAINLLIVAALSAAYITYRYLTTSATTILSWIFLVVAIIGATHYFRLSRW